MSRADEDTRAERTEDAAGLELGQVEAREFDETPIWRAMLAEFGDPFADREDEDDEDAPEGEVPHTPIAAPGDESGPDESDAARPEAAAPSGPDNQTETTE